MDHKRQWLHLQLHPHLLSSNGQDDLFHQLGRDLDNYFKKENLDLSQKIDIIRSLSHEILQSVREALGLNLRKRKPIPLYVVIDECHFAVTDMENHYRSSQWTTKRGILCEWRDGGPWDEVLNRSADGRLLNVFIFTGTGLSREIISDVLSSVVMKPEYCTSVYDTGCLLGSTVMDHTLLGKYCNTRRAQGMPRMENGQVVVEPAKQNKFKVCLHIKNVQFQGRIDLASKCGYQNMHQLLDQYIHSVAGFRPADFESPEKSFFGMVELPALTFGFEKLNEQMREKVKTIAHECLFTSKLETYLGTDERSYIELGISGYDGQKSIKIDEPLVLLSCSVWFNEQRPHTVYKTLADHIQKHDPTTGRNGFEEFIAFYLLKVFEKSRQLNHVFDFEGAADNGLGDREARLVTLHVDESGRKPKVVEGEVSLSKGASSLFGPIGLAIGSDNHSVLNEWMNLRRHATFCFPMNLMGPDIMCFLKLKGKRSRKFTYVCLAIQCKFFRAETLRPCTLRGATATVTPGKFFEGDPSSDHAMNRKRILNALQNLKSKDSAAGKYGIVRVICGFPVHVNLGKAFPIAVNAKSGNKRQRVITKDPDQDDDHPLGKLRTSLLISTTGNEHPTDILEVIRQSALNAKRRGLNFLDKPDPAVLGIDQYQNSDPNNKTVDSIESEIAQLVIHPGSKRKC
ncbi:hypothetical protein F5876DRAFT_65218 [Lentinula aff. lateritia]|uniref:Uncharacterized protein n=1 Tax=Lentinula aff. lateritia TaxID=2804960 RepID=A0ACC1U2G5_9AGAR|nr:hypothetical protein F5876DRAFT_65218 [Lentinula aff. lateritia]